MAPEIKILSTLPICILATQQKSKKVNVMLLSRLKTTTKPHYEQKHTGYADVQSSKIMVAISVQHHHGYSQDVQTFSFNSTSLTDTDQKPFFSLLISAVVLISLK